MFYGWLCLSFVLKYDSVEKVLYVEVDLHLERFAVLLYDKMLSSSHFHQLRDP